MKRKLALYIASPPYQINAMLKESFWYRAMMKRKPCPIHLSILMEILITVLVNTLYESISFYHHNPNVY